MEFKDRFKKGDVICSDNFWSGSLMIVEEWNEPTKWHDGYFTCEDMFKNGQKWSAHDISNFGNPYNWRLATNEDYIKQIAKRINYNYKISEFMDCTVTDKGINITDLSDETIYLEPEEAIKLRDIINQYVGS